MKKIIYILIAITFSSCATIINGSRQSIPVNSNPAGAAVMVNGENKGTTPTVVTLKRNGIHTIRVEQKGYVPYSVAFAKKGGAILLGNVVFGGIPGLIVDLATGAYRTLVPENVQADLKPTPSN